MIEWEWLPFASLNASQLYTLLALRSEVFVVEQRCVYFDPDGLDMQAWHLLGWQDVAGKRQLVAYLRCLPAGIKFEELSLGRVLTSSAVRGQGAGKALLTQALQRVAEEFGPQPIRIAAQSYLLRFYQSFGFQACSEAFDDDGVEHIEMLLPRKDFPVTNLTFVHT